MFEFLPPRVRLAGLPQPGEDDARKLAHDFERFRDGLPQSLEDYVLSTYGVSLASRYGGLNLKNSFGKASGQLSVAVHQVEKDAEAGLGFAVLKTLIAQDRAGAQSMREWAIPETHMAVERIRGRSGAEGWTVTWKGRGWYDTFDAYCELFDRSLAAAKTAGMLVVPSVKYHLPTPEERSWKNEEYEFTTAALADVWRRHSNATPMPLEKDFSPTLAGSARASAKAKVLEWIATVPGLVHRARAGGISLGLKIFNALFEDDFQLEMLGAATAASPGVECADFLVYANRLFDPARNVEGHQGVAYGGPDLSERNLAVLERWLDSRPASRLPISATGDIASGRVAAEYMLRGASSFQIHTLFQLPENEYAMRTGTKTTKALHRLLFHPQEGFIAWALDLRRRFGWKPGINVEETANWCREHWKTIRGSMER
jgi:hypothetical protein